MLNGLKNFAINRVLRHVAENPKLNTATNWLALIPLLIAAALNGGADWMLMAQCCDAPGSLAEVVRVAGLIVVAAILWFCGKWPGLKAWLPVAQEIIAEARKEAEEPSK